MDLDLDFCSVFVSPPVRYSTVAVCWAAGGSAMNIHGK